MAKRDYYDTLGVNRQADEKEIKSAYRKLAMANHPDRNPDDEAAATRFREASEAYEILKDDQKRAAYDRLGHAAFEQHGRQGGFSRGGGGGFGGAGFSDIFDQMFSEFGQGRQGGRRAGPQKGDDMRYDLEVSLEEAYHGAIKDVTPTLATKCGICGGNGAQKGSQPVKCGTCHGMGKVRVQQGFFTIERTCPSCQGQGMSISNPCRNCKGEGRIETNQKLSVSIPSGVDDGTRIRLSGKGEAGWRGGPQGDLYIFIQVKPHEFFGREGSTVYLNVPVPMITATLGGVIDVPTLAGKTARLQIDAGTQTGKKFRMRGKGMPALRGASMGDQIVAIEVETPANLNKEQIKLLKDFDKAGHVSPKSASFAHKIKKSRT